MPGLDGSMKLRLRTALVVCGALSFCAICLTISRLPTVHEHRRVFLPRNDVPRTFSDDTSGEFPHIFTYRKRLNKSNYTSDNISPEMAKRALEIKTAQNDTREDMKYQSDGFNDILNETAHETQRTNKLTAFVTNSSFNISSRYVDKMLNALQTANGLKFNFEKTRKVPYKNFLKLQSKRLRRRGMGLPIYENYNGG